MQWTTGNRRVFWQLSTPWQNSAFEPRPRPAQLPLMPTVRQLLPHTNA
ncbi:MAG: hypothetical protein AB1589_42565 [Cyanobacteriota bacterium]